LKHIQCLEPVISPGGNQPGREADHSASISVKGKKEWSYTSLPSIRPHRADRDNFGIIIKNISIVHFVTKTRIVLKNFKDFTTEAFSITHMHVSLYTA
jgi:hypothetical protein